VRFLALPDFSEVVSLKRGPLSLVSLTEDIRKWKISGSGSRKPRLTAVGIRCADHATPKSGGILVGIVCLRTKATEFSFSLDPPTDSFSNLCKKGSVSALFHLNLTQRHNSYIIWSGIVQWLRYTRIQRRACIMISDLTLLSSLLVITPAFIYYAQHNI
jgi:hypothetical protein